MGKIGNLLKKLDMNPSTEDSFKVRTTTGAFSRINSLFLHVVSVITLILMGTLFWGELKLYMTIVQISHLDHS